MNRSKHLGQATVSGQREDATARADCRTEADGRNVDHDNPLDQFAEEGATEARIGRQRIERRKCCQPVLHGKTKANRLGVRDDDVENADGNARAEDRER